MMGGVCRLPTNRLGVFLPWDEKIDGLGRDLFLWAGCVDWVKLDSAFFCWAVQFKCGAVCRLPTNSTAVSSVYNFHFEIL